MNTGEDEPATGLNGRLRPRKSNHSPQSNQISRKSENKTLPDKSKRTSNLKISANKTDDLVNKSDNTIPQHFCPYCDKTFISKQTALKHVHLIHISSSKDFFFDCLFCNHVEHNSNIIHHMVDSHPNQYFACLDCHTRFPSTSEVAQHKLNVCEKQKLPYRSKLRQKSLENKKKSSKSDTTQSILRDNKDFTEGFNGIVISCELKPTKVHDDADIEDNITTNLILPSSKGISHKAAIEKNAIIVLDDIQWNKRIPSNFSFHNSDADQILTRLGVVHRSPRTGESTKKDWQKPSEDGTTQKFEKCFDMSFYMKVASNVQENLLKHLDGSFNDIPELDSIIKTRKSKDCVHINTAEGFPILLASEQYSRNLLDGFVPRAIAPKHKWKWDSPDNDRAIINVDQSKSDLHLNNCIITYVSNLDIWTQLSMRKKFDEKFSSLRLEKKTEMQNTISKELKEILESKEIPMLSTQAFKKIGKPTFTEFHFPANLGLTPTTQSFVLQPAVLSGESVRPRCYVCCACGVQAHDSRALSSHISTQHPNAQIEHYEIVGESLLNANIFKHLYVPPSQIFNRSRPLRGIRECTKCKKSITLEDLHQHMLDCAGDTPTVRRKCRYRPFGVRKRRPRLPDNRIRKKMRKEIRAGQRNDKNRLRPRPKTRSEVGDAETIRKMLADLPAKRHRVTVNPLNSFPRKKYDRKLNQIMSRKHSFDQKYVNVDQASDTKISSSSSNADSKDSGFNNDDDDEDDNLPLRPKTRDPMIKGSSHKNESLNKKAIINRSKRKSNKESELIINNTEGALSGCIESTEPDKISLDNTPNRVDLNSDPQKFRAHSNREGSNNRESPQSGRSGQGGNSHNANAPTQNVPLKHSIASLTADSETHDKAVQFHRLFLVQQECNNGDEHHLPSDRRVLFENEAVVTKLDKPPLHFNHNRAFEYQNSRKNKLSKPRKGLNDCIAMLKNKLTPKTDSDIPGHVSVQCGSDEPIDMEPIYIGQGFDVIEANQGHINKAISQPHLSEEDKSMKTSDANDHRNTHKSSTDVISLDKVHVTNTHIEDQCQNKAIPRENDALNDVVLSPTRLAPLPPPRNTVIHKSPKISGNQIQQEEKMILQPQISECKDYSSKNKDQNIKTTEIPSTMSKDFSKSFITPGVQNSSIVTDKDALVDLSKNSNVINLTRSNYSIPLNLNSANNLTQSHSQYVSTNRPEVDQNVDSSRKINSQYYSAKYNNIPLKIPPAHARTSFEPLTPVPLDLSGKTGQTDTSLIYSLQDRRALTMNSYNSYETLDLSNKNTDADKVIDNSTVADDGPLDVVVDLSVKQTPQSSTQSSPTNLSTKSPENSTGLTYESIQENFPTDLSLRKRSRSSSSPSTSIPSQECDAIDYVQDLSSHKLPYNGISNENFIAIDHMNKESPRELSNRDMEDNPMVTDLLSHETNSSELSRISSTHTATNKSQDVDIDNTPESPFSNSNEDSLNVEDNDSNYILHSPNNDSINRSHSQNQLSPFNDTDNVNSSDINETIGSLNLVQSSIEPNGGQINEIIKSQSSKPYADKICFVVPQDQLPYEIDNSTLNITIMSNGDSVPLYQSVNENGTTQEARNSQESTTPVYSLENVSVPLNTSSLPVTNFYNVPEETISSSTSGYNEVETVRNANIIPNHGIEVNTNEKCLILRNNNLAETNRIVEYTATRRNGTPDVINSDLTNEIINRVAEQDTETARKIAMLPQELVEILGTMPVDHRNQLLNVLPQYVSASASTTGSETRKCLINKQQDLFRNRNYDEKLSHMNNLTQAVESDVLYPTSTVLSPESVPQSVILKAPVVSNESYQATSKTCEREFSSTFTTERNSTHVQRRQSKLVNFEEVASVIIDLTDDENVKEIINDVRIIEGDIVPLNNDFDKSQNLDKSLDLLRHKGNNEQTANLRAVRMKTTHERTKQILLEDSLEYRSFQNNTNDNEQIIEIAEYDDLNAENTGIRAYTENLRIAEDRIDTPLLNCIDSNKSFNRMNENITFNGPLNINDSFLVNSTLILTPISNKENSIVLPGMNLEKVTNNQSNDLSNSMGEEIILLDDTDTHGNQIQIIPMNEDYRSSPLKKPIAIGDEDSEDDVTLAVIVKKKQRQQKQPSVSSDYPLHTDAKYTVRENKKVKPDEMTKSVLQYTAIEQLPNNQQGAVKMLAITLDDINNLKLKNGNDIHQDNSDVLSTCENSSIKMDITNCELQRIPKGGCTSPKAIDQIKTKDFQKVYNEDINMQSVANDSSSKLESREHCIVQNNNLQSQTVINVEENQFSNENHDVCIDKTKLSVNSPQISQLSSKENIKKLKRIRGKPIKKKCIIRNCILHSYVGNLYRRSLYYSKQSLAPHLQGVCTGVPISKIKKLVRFEQQRRKHCSEIRKSQQISLRTEEINPLPLRRSRRGKSMFVDNSSAESYVPTPNSKPSEQKLPLTKKQLIFSKLLLDEERITQPKTDKVIAKEPVVLIKDLNLSGHVLSSVSQNNKNTKELELSSVSQDKRSKRKKSPQSKRKYKKQKFIEDTVEKTLSTSIVTNIKDPNSNEIPKGKTNNQLSQENESFVLLKDVSAPLLIDKNKNNLEPGTNSNSAIESSFTEKRKTCTLTSDDNNHNPECKKSKLINDTGSETRKPENIKQNVVETWRISRPRNNDVTKNTPCYNSHTPARRTRSKSVVVKSSTPLYDPYDIDLEDMAEKDDSFGRLTSNKGFSKLSFTRDKEVKKRNKNEPSTSVKACINTKPTTEKNKDLIPIKELSEKVKRTYSKEDISDSDDSSKSDIPLQKYVDEKVKKKSRQNRTADANNSAQEKNKSGKIRKSKKKKDTQNVTNTTKEQQNRDEQFMESFGFFSHRKPRKSNLIAAKKISETFNAIEADDTNDDEKVPITSKQEAETKKPNEDKSTSANPAQSVTKTPAKRGRKKAVIMKPAIKFCVICNKEFKRPDNYLRHQITLLHISKLSEIEMKVKTIPVVEEPNYLIPYKQQLDRLKMISVSKKKKNIKPSKAPLPTLGEILAKVNKTFRDQHLLRRNLSRDEALFIDCCELLKESHKPDLSNNTEQVTTIISTTTDQIPETQDSIVQATTAPSNAEQVTISNNKDEALTLQNNEQVTVLNEVNTVLTDQVEVIQSVSKNITNSDEYELRSDGDVDSITAKNILESEEVRNLENDLLSGLKEAAAQSLAHASSNFVLQQTLSATESDGTEKIQSLSNTIGANKNCEDIKSHEVVPQPPKKISKPRKKQEVKDNMYSNATDNINIFEDKFDKIKRKCRSKAAAAKHVPPIIEPIASQKGRKKSENKRERTSKKDNYSAIPTKGALKGFDGLKVSVPNSDINVSTISSPSENTSKGKKISRNQKDRVEVEPQTKPNQDLRVKTTQSQKIDVYEFMDSEDVEVFDFRPSTLMERFKNIGNRDMPSTSKLVPATDEMQFSCESGSDGDDFVYDDYVCSDDETENSIMSCELGNSTSGIESKTKNNSPLKRKDATEKNAVMGKIFKHNAVRTERKDVESVDNVRPQANLDQLFDSLLVDEPGAPSVSTKLPKKDSSERESTPSKRHVSSKRHESSKRHDSSKKHESSKKHDSSHEASKRHDSSKKHESSEMGGYSKKRDTSKKHDFSHEASKKNESSKKHEASKKHESSEIDAYSKKHDTSKKHDSSHEASKKHESSEIEGYSKKHWSSGKHDSSKHQSSKRYESSKKHGHSKKHESSKKRECSKTRDSLEKHEYKEYEPSSHRKRQSVSDYEDESPSKQGVKTSKQHSGKDYPSTSYDITNIDVSYNDRNINNDNLICKPSTSKDYNYEIVQETVQSSPKKHSSYKYTKSSSDEYHSSTPKKSRLGGHRSSKESFYPTTNIYLNVRSERYSREMISYNRDTIVVHNKDSGPSDLYINHFRKYARDRSITPDMEEDNGSNSDTLDEATSDDAGVARQRARRKCTVGKQNILAETWSSESEPESGPPRANSTESKTSGGRKKGKKKREGPYGSRRGVSRQMPILRQDLENRVALFKRTTTSSGGRGIQGSSSGAGPSSAACTSGLFPSSYTSGGSAGPSGLNRSHHSRSGGPHTWSSEANDEHHQQHGWIVGVSHKKLVTMLAHAKGRKRNHDDKSDYVE